MNSEEIPRTMQRPGEAPLCRAPFDATSGQVLARHVCFNAELIRGAREDSRDNTCTGALSPKNFQGQAAKYRNLPAMPSIPLSLDTRGECVVLSVFYFILLFASSVFFLFVCF
jgi:hypothetical protein